MLRCIALVAGCCHGRWRDTLAIYDATAAGCDTSETLEFSNYGAWNLGQHGMGIEEANPSPQSTHGCAFR